MKTDSDGAEIMSDGSSSQRVGTGNWKCNSSFCAQKFLAAALAAAKVKARKNLKRTC